MKKATEEERKARLAAYVEEVASNAPPLTPAQRDKLALLLRPRAVKAGSSAVERMMRGEK